MGKEIKTLDKFLEEMGLEESITESNNKISDEVYSAMTNFAGFNQLGMDQQGDLVKTIVDKLKKFGIK